MDLLIFSACLLLGLTLCSNHVSANVTPYSYSNDTTAKISKSPPSPKPTTTKPDCRTNCTAYLTPIYFFQWTPVAMISTYIVETVILHVHKGSNQTSTEISSTTGFSSRSRSTPEHVNADGTHFSVIDGATVAFPNDYMYFNREALVIGTLATSSNGMSTCLKPSTRANENESPYLTVTLPPLPDDEFGKEDSGPDPRGWTFELVLQGQFNFQDLFGSLFPDLGLWKCHQNSTEDIPLLAVVEYSLTEVSYLTYKTTSTKTDDREKFMPGGLQPNDQPSPQATSSSRAVMTSSTPLVESVPQPPPRAAEVSASIVKPTSMPQDPPSAAADYHDEAPFLAGSGASIVENPVLFDHEDGKSPNQPDVGQVSSELSDPDERNTNAPQADPSPADQSQYHAFQSSFIIADTTINALHDNEYIVSSQNLIPGLPVTIGLGPSKTVVRILTGANGNGNAIVVDSDTYTLPMGTASPQRLALSPVVVNGVTVNVKSAPNYLWHGQILSPGSTLTLGSGPSATSIALQTGADGSVRALVVGSSTSPLPTPESGSLSGVPALLSLNGETVTADTAPMFFASGQKLAVGSSIILGPADSRKTLELQTVAGDTAVIVNGVTSVLPMSESAPGLRTPPPIVVNGETISADYDSRYTVSGMVLTPGSSITIGSGSSATEVALRIGNGGTTLVVGSSTSVLSATDSTPPPIVVNGQTIRADSASRYTVSGMILTLGSSITIKTGASATVVALETGTGGTTLIVGSSTSVLSASRPTPPPIVVNGNTISADSASQYIVSGKMLTLGSSITIGSGNSATVVALTTGVDGTTLIVGSSTSILSGPEPTPPPIIVNGVTISANSASQYIVSGQTLRLGSTINIGGSLTTKIALQTGLSGLDLVVGSSTSVIQDVPITSSTATSIGGETSKPGSVSSNVPDVSTKHKKSGAILNADKATWALCFMLCLCGMWLMERVLDA